MLRVDQVHVIRHKVLVEGRSQRQVAKEFGISRVTVRKYVEEPVPVRKETGPRPRPVWEKVGARIEALLGESPQWTGGKQLLTATRLHGLLVGEGHQGGDTLVKDVVGAWQRRRAAAGRGGGRGGGGGFAGSGGVAVDGGRRPIAPGPAANGTAPAARRGSS